jgi:hypothetical protein
MRAPEGPLRGHVISGQNTRKKGGKSNFWLQFFSIFLFFFFKYGKMIYFYNVTQVTLHFKRWISTLWLLMLLDVEYYTTYPKTPEKGEVNPNFQLCISAPEGTPSGSRHFQ